MCFSAEEIRREELDNIFDEVYRNIQSLTPVLGNSFTEKTTELSDNQK